MGWFGSIFNARECEDEELSKEGSDGNYTYDKSGTYGQSDFTVREREDGTSDVYVKSDSERGHSHDHIDSDGNLLDHYHDMIFRKIANLSYEELQLLEATTDNDYIKRSARILLEINSYSEFTFTRRLVRR